jgi:hypothetical protein
MEKDYRLGCWAFINGYCCIDKCFCSGQKNKETRLKNKFMPLKQHNQLGKVPKKNDLLNARAGKTFVTPLNREFVFNYRREGRKYIFILTYRGHNIQVKESEFNLTPIDDLLRVMDKELNDANEVIEPLAS